MRFDIFHSTQLGEARGRVWWGARVAQLESVHVAAPRRGQGIGNAMMQWAIEEARAAGCNRVQLTSHKSRTDSHRFYHRLGFVASHEGMKLFLG